MATPVTSSNIYGGIFQYLVQINGTPAQVEAAKAKLAATTPTTAAVYAALNLLPQGGLKKWLTANPVQFWKMIYTAIFGKKYTTGDYILGERLNDQVYCNAGINRSQVSNQMVDVAHRVFNQLFGVRIATDDDLTALEAGVGAYKAREVSYGMSNAAINRAVFLKQHYFQSSTYNKQCWDLRYFELYPLVDRIPDYEIGKWYTGDVIGGAYAEEGVIPVSATDILDQYLNASFDIDTGIATASTGQQITPGGATIKNFADKIISFVKTDPIRAAAVGAALWFAWTEIEND